MRGTKAVLILPGIIHLVDVIAGQDEEVLAFFTFGARPEQATFIVGRMQRLSPDAG